MSTQRVVCIAVVSRAVCFTMSYVARLFGTAYDSSSSLQVAGCSPLVDHSSVREPGFHSKFVWDSVFFSRIALCGYEYEQYYAFFPFLPGINCVAAELITASTKEAHSICRLWMPQFMLMLLWRLSRDVLKDDRMADLATLLYIWNPASVFYSAAYTESIFACAAFTGFYLLSQQPWLATICLSIASATRSNGILHCWLLLYKLAKVIVDQQCLCFQDAEYVWLLLQVGLQCILVCLPVLLFQFSGWLSFCHKGIVERPWCSSSLPNIYSFVQSHYWGVGFLRYFKLQQIPNFLLAMPMLYISFAGCYQYLRQDWTRSLQLHLCPTHPSSGLGKKLQSKGITAQRHNHMMASKILYTKAPEGFISNEVAPYIHQWAVMTACALLLMNVQVATRFLSACPALYWFAASHIRTRKWTWIWGYFLAYFCLGYILFTLFYPWT